MRIALYTGGKAHWLAGDPSKTEREHSSVADFSVDPVIEVQTNKFIRAVEASHHDRRNIDTTISWSTTRKFNTVAEAQRWMLEYDMTMPRTGTLQMHLLSGNNNVIIRYLHNCVVLPPSRRATGVSVHLTYQAKGGRITNANPD